VLVLALRKNMKVNQIVGEQKTMSRAAKGHEKYGKDGMKALAKAGREGAGEKTLDTIRDKHDKYDEGVAGPKKCWPGYKKTGTQAGTGKNAGKRVNDCEKIEEGVMSQLALELGEIADEEDYDKLYNLLSDDGPVGQYLHDQINDIQAETGLHPKDDFEKIESMLMNRVQREFGEQDIAEETPGQELGTIGAVKPDGTVEVKKADGSSTVVQQQELKPGATPNTLTMPVPKINPGEKVLAAPVAESAELTAMLRIAGLR
jgi:hypothetical protein